MVEGDALPVCDTCMENYDEKVAPLIRELVSDEAWGHCNRHSDKDRKVPNRLAYVCSHIHQHNDWLSDLNDNCKIGK